MEINNLQLNTIGAYRKVAKQTAVKKSDTSLKAGPKTDKIEFDFGRSLAAAKSGAASRINESAGEEKIAMLSRAYAGDSCPVSSMDIAAAIIA